MSETQPLTVDFTQEDDVLQILPRLALRSSDRMGWNGIYVQQHQQPAWETPDYAHTRHMLLVHSTNVAVQAERWFDGRRQQEQFGGRNNIAIVPATVEHRANWNRESPFSLLFLDRDRLVQVAYESVRTESVRLIPQYAMHDPLIEQIGKSLTAELETNLFGSQLFADSLTRRVGDLFLKYGEELAFLQAKEMGRLFTDSMTVDIPHLAKMFHYYAGWASKIEGSVKQTTKGLHTYTLREPLGVVAAITPCSSTTKGWNSLGKHLRSFRSICSLWWL